MTEKIVYIHGVVATASGASHTGDYRALHDGVDGELRRIGQPGLPRFNESCLVEWGWSTPKAADTKNLAKAQRNVYRRVERATPRDRTSLSNLVFAPAIQPVRDLLTLGWSDILYYVGKDGKENVRSVVWNAIIDSVDPTSKTDLTVICHSAGTLIAHDFLFWLFSRTREDRMGGNLPAVESMRAARRNWRIRRLVTMGSPISALFVRSAAVTEIMAGSTGAKLDAADLGLGRQSHSGDDPVWLNVWDRHDVLAYPVAPFYSGAAIQDLYPDHSDSLLGSHEAYWEARSVHRQLAENW